jgi:hypothetical protein
MLSSKKGAMLHSSKSLLQSLTALGSECCITSSFASRLGLQPIKRSSSSLYLQGHSESSFCSQMGALAHAHAQAEKPEVPHSTLRPLLPTDSDSVNVLQCLLLVAMTLQIPNYIDEIIELLELHMHTFPLLIVLGLFPSLYLKKKQHKKDSSSNLVPRSTSSAASSKTLAGIEAYYRNCAEFDSAFVTSPLAKSSSTQTLTDDWGHFTEIDESMQY